MKRIHDIYRPTEERKNDWREVERMLTDDELKEQTKRCMNCGQPFCHAYGCPLGNLVPDQNRAVAQGDWRLAYDLLSAHSDFPEFTSRIRYGIPCFKLDKALVDRRRKILEAEGIQFMTGVEVGKDVSADWLARRS